MQTIFWNRKCFNWTKFVNFIRSAEQATEIVTALGLAKIILVSKGVNADRRQLATVANASRTWDLAPNAVTRGNSIWTTKISQLEKSNPNSCRECITRTPNSQCERETQQAIARTCTCRQWYVRFNGQCLPQRALDESCHFSEQCRSKDSLSECTTDAQTNVKSCKCRAGYKKDEWSKFDEFVRWFYSRFGLK